MSKLACRACGREVYAAAPLESLFAEERRCPRCGAYLQDDRRVEERRHWIRRSAVAAAAVPDGERRITDRRVARRRRAENGGWRPR